ncbi:hypothetical protein TUM17568_57430 [Klebsiella oxytoca]|nr:hypothetical protein TUM17568_57430 [Klebsiella oxytoca]
MNSDALAAIIANDLDSLIHRIEALPAHPRFTDALNAVHAAKKAVSEGRVEVHHQGMRERFAASDAS